MADVINVQVIYTLPDRQEMISITLPVGATLKTAVEASGLLQKYPEIDVESGRFGIYARVSRLNTELRDQDRVEIYRSLIADPKEVRRQRANAGRPLKSGMSATSSAGESPDS